MSVHYMQFRLGTSEHGRESQAVRASDRQPARGSERESQATRARRLRLAVWSLLHRYGEPADSIGEPADSIGRHTMQSVYFHTCVFHKAFSCSLFH